MYAYCQISVVELSVQRRDVLAEKHVRNFVILIEDAALNCQESWENASEIVDITKDDKRSEKNCETWTKIGDTTLNTSDRMVLKSGGWLNDKLISAAQKL